MPPKLIEKLLTPLVGKLLGAYIESQQVDDAAVGDEIRVEGAIKRVRAFKRKARVDVVFVIQE